MATSPEYQEDDVRIGLIGLGGMGMGLAKNMAAKGVDLSVSDIDSKRVDLAVAQGGKRVKSTADMASHCDVVMVCVTTAETVQAIALGDEGLLANMKPGAILVDHTTVSVEHVDKMRAACEAHGIDYCEAPMTRTPAHADKGEVNILFGGQADLLERLRPVFETYAENIFHVGPAGHAIKLKLIHNYIAFANVASFCEGFALAAAEGLDMTKVIGIISAAGGKSGMMDLYGEITLQRDFSPHMSLANAQKDVRYYAEWIEAAGLPGFMARSVHQSYALASILGHGEEGCTAIIKSYERFSGVEAALPKVGSKGKQVC